MPNAPLILFLTFTAAKLGGATWSWWWFPVVLYGCFAVNIFTLAGLDAREYRRRRKDL